MLLTNFNFSTEVDIPSKATQRGSKIIDKHLGFAFVQFETKEDADQAISKFNGTEFKGRNIYTKKAVPPPTEEEKQEKIEAYKLKQAEIKKIKNEKKAAKIEAIKAKKASTPKPKTETESDEPKDKIPVGTKSEDTIFITNLDFKVDVQTLNNLFKELKPKWIHVPTRRVPYFILKKQRENGKSVRNKGIAFVKFSSEELQKKAVAEYNGKELNGREIIVDIAIDTRIPKDEDKEESTESTD